MTRLNDINVLFKLFRQLIGFNVTVQPSYTLSSKQSRGPACVFLSTSAGITSNPCSQIFHKDDPKIKNKLSGSIICVVAMVTMDESLSKIVRFTILENIVFV